MYCIVAMYYNALLSVEIHAHLHIQIEEDNGSSISLAVSYLIRSYCYLLSPSGKNTYADTAAAPSDVSVRFSLPLDRDPFPRSVADL